MGVHVHYTGVRYAVIQASSKKDRPERLAIAYQGENSLRDLIAAPSIIGLGFVSREEAIANLEDPCQTPLLRNKNLESQQCFTRLMRTVTCRAGHGLVKHRRIPQSIVQSAFAAVIALFYSKNIVSVMIRMALGASF